MTSPQSSEPTFTVRQVGQRIAERVREWQAEFWVRGELSDVSLHTPSGRFFATLTEANARGQIVAKLPIVTSRAATSRVNRRLATVGQSFSDGIDVRLFVGIDFYARSGSLQLAVRDIDPQHTVGVVAARRRELLETLQAEGALERNAAQQLPRLPLRVGLITRRGSQAYHDLVDELHASNLPFEVTVCSTGVQGLRAAGEITRALSSLVDRVDVVVIVRGGGSDSDLAAFDDPTLARAICSHPQQVWAGIGHHLDTPVAEYVAAQRFKTPTAVGVGLVAEAQDAIDSVEELWDVIAANALTHQQRKQRWLREASHRTQSARLALGKATNRLDFACTSLQTSVNRRLERACQHLDDSFAAVTSTTRHALASQHEQLNGYHQLVDAYDPARLLQRGWSITTTASGQRVTEPVPAGTELLTVVEHATIRSTVSDSTPRTTTSTQKDDE